MIAASFRSSFPTVIGGLRRFLGWWIAELAGVLPARMRLWLAGDTAVPVLDTTGSSASLHLLYRSSIASLVTPAVDEFSLAETVEAALRRHRVDRSTGIGVILPPSRILTLEIDLPQAAAARIADVLHYEVERRTPFRKDEVHVGGTVISRNGAAGRIRARMVVALREEVAAWHRRLAGSGWIVRGIYTRDPSLPDALPHEVITLTQRSDIRMDRWRMAQAGLAMIMVLCLGAAKWWEISTLSAAVDQMTGELTAGRPAMQRAAAMEKELLVITDRARALQDRQQRVATRKVLEHLADLFPDDTWLVRAHIAYPVVTLTGHSAGAARVMTALGGSPMFRDPNFQTATTIAPDQSERFDIVARLADAVMR